MIGRLYNAPSIIMWVVNNEGWGQYESKALAQWVKAIDPSRLTNSNSGWLDRNQKFTVLRPAAKGTTTGPIWTVHSGTDYCLKTPAYPGSPEAYPTVTACNQNSPTTDEMWTVHDNDSASTGFEIEDYQHHCLAANDINGPYNYVHSGTTSSKIIVTVCDGGGLQKWNAPPTITKQFPLQNVREN